MKHPSPILLCAACAPALCAALLAGCGGVGPPAAASSAPAPAAGQSAGASLPAAFADDTLRLFQGCSGGYTVLRGTQVLWQGGSTATAALGEDLLSGQSYYYTETNAPDNPAMRQLTVYDAAGAQLYQTASPYRCFVQKAGEALLVLEGENIAGEQYRCRLVDLAGGEEHTLRASHAAWSTDGAGYLLLSLRPAIDPDTGGSYSGQRLGAAVYVYAPDGSLAAVLEGCAGYSGGQSWPLPAGWVLLAEYTLDDAGLPAQSLCLYCPATGERIAGVAGVCGPGLACLRDGAAGYTVWDIQGRAVLASYPSPCAFYGDGVALLPGSGLLCTPEGGQTPLLAWDLGPDGLACLSAEGALHCYSPTGALLATAQPDLLNLAELAKGGDASVLALPGGLAQLELYDAAYNYLGCVVYGPQGLVLDTRGSHYTRVQLLAGGSGGCVFAAVRPGPGGCTLTDLLGAGGGLLLAGLGDANAGTALPDGWFWARRGFACGWMDSSGSWAYSQSLFDTLGAEDGRAPAW